MRPLEKARNLGPVSAAELESIGIRTLAQMRQYGWEEVCVRWAEAFPARINLNAFISVIGAIDDVDWRRVDPELRRQAQSLARRLKAAARPV